MARPTDTETARLFVIRRGQKDPITENERFLIDYIDKVVDDLQVTANALADERMEHGLLQELLSRPEIDDFWEGIVTEAAHQRQRWGDAHDRSKSAENWFWLVGYLSGKALRASIEGQKAKAKHHTISSAAALFQWHQAIKADETDRGVGADADISPEGGRLGTEPALAGEGG